MRETISAARHHRVAVGAHPSLFDRENFGRKELPVTFDDVFEAVTYQLGVFQAITEAVGVRANHVKPHGALYNMAVRDEKLAEAIARAKSSPIETTCLMARLCRGYGPTPCYLIRTRRLHARCGCCAKAKLNPSME
jgi:UPF0271 protein